MPIEKKTATVTTHFTEQQREILEKIAASEGFPSAGVYLRHLADQNIKEKTRLFLKLRDAFGDVELSNSSESSEEQVAMFMRSMLDEVTIHH